MSNAKLVRERINGEKDALCVVESNTQCMDFSLTKIFVGDTLFSVQLFQIAKRKKIKDVSQYSADKIQ